MNILARCVLAQCTWLCATLAHSSAADPVAAIADCRALHAEHPSEHIACLERELRARGAAPAEKTVQPGLGAEQVRVTSSHESVEQVTVEIENVTYSFDGLGSFRMTDGQVWKASESTPRGQRLELDKRYSARIERGKLGGYRMYVDGVRRMIKVRRTE